MQVTTLGIDLAQRVFQVHGVDKHGKGGLHKRLSRDQLLPFLANLARASSGSKPVGGPTIGRAPSNNAGTRAR
jgi:transposase